MTNKALDNLLKSDETATSPHTRLSQFEYNKRKIIGILASLRKPSDQYEPQKTISSIRSYITAGDRILYSELTSAIYAMDEEERGTVTTNLDSLTAYTFDESNGVEDDIRKIVIRLWDHFNLACIQADNANHVLALGVESTKEELYNELSGKFSTIEREYITILGIFAAVILAFVGGITFSSSVLQHIDNVSIYRLVFVILLLGFVLTNTINLLLRYIFKLNFVKKEKIRIWPFNLIVVILMLLTIVSWATNMKNLPAYISQWIPW